MHECMSGSSKGDFVLLELLTLVASRNTTIPVVSLYFHDIVKSTNGLQQLLVGKKTVTGWKFVI